MSHDLEHRRHSLAHLLAAAVLELYPDAKRTIGPAIENGFYYDFYFTEPLSEDALPKIEKRMRKLLPTFKAFERNEVHADEARTVFADNKYKLELINEFAKDGQTLSLYTSGKFVDLCRGGHSEGLAGIDPDSFKLTKVAGAYWRGDEKNDQLTRIYGLAFETKTELEAHLTMLEEAKRRDHRKLGKELGLFVFSDLVGPGLPLWTPKGTVIREVLNQFVWELRRPYGYERVAIPHITKKDLYETSGHWAKYAEDLFKIETREGHVFAMKPMNCPHHAQIYASEQHSYRELPIRYAETTMVYRDEQSGELSGLSRVLSITQDDAHVFCRVSQVRQEAEIIWGIIQTFYGAFGFSLKPRLSLRDPEQPQKYLGAPEDWDKAEAALRDILTEKGVEWVDGPGEAAFYGPKIDFMANDAIGRTHQVATIQLDFNQPKNFGLECVNEKGEKEGILMIHCAIMGSIERFTSVIIEHLAGAFPFWLAPEQVRIATVSDDYIPAAQKIVSSLRTAGIRVKLDDASEKVGKKIRDAAMQKVPWTIVIGAKEAEGGDFQVKVYGKEESLVIAADQLISQAVSASQLPKA
ncbi:threonine--tRNA ligase [Patescibacteria group bacterium]|nr:threonine--tRNA ligase [Patescibacteria group bacterium]